MYERLTAKMIKKTNIMLHAKPFRIIFWAVDRLGDQENKYNAWCLSLPHWFLSGWPLGWSRKPKQCTYITLSHRILNGWIIVVCLVLDFWPPDCCKQALTTNLKTCRTNVLRLVVPDRVPVKTWKNTSKLRSKTKSILIPGKFPDFISELNLS